MASGTRRRMVETAVRMFQRDGYHATSWRALVDEAGAPWGSIAHHFPGGKEELGAAAVEAGGDAVAGVVEHCFADGLEPAEMVRRWFSTSRTLLVASGYTAGCPIATVVLEASGGSPAIRAAAARAFDRWEEAIGAALRRAGASPGAADDAAATVVVLLEGALLLARARRDDRPLRVASEQAQLVVAAAVA